MGRIWTDHGPPLLPLSTCCRVGYRVLLWTAPIPQKYTILPAATGMADPILIDCSREREWFRTLIANGVRKHFFPLGNAQLMHTDLGQPVLFRSFNLFGSMVTKYVELLSEPRLSSMPCFCRIMTARLSSSSKANRHSSAARLTILSTWPLLEDKKIKVS